MTPEQFSIDGVDNVRILDSPMARARGVIGRYPGPAEAYVFPFDDVGDRGVHMIGVSRPLRVTWYREGRIVADETLRPWLGRASHQADMVVERRPDMGTLPDQCPECGAAAVQDAAKQLSGDASVPFAADWYCTNCGASNKGP